MSQAGEQNSSMTLLEAGVMWEQLALRYDLVEGLSVLMNYPQDRDLRNIMQRTLKQITRRAEQLEKALTQAQIALPPRPPAHVTIAETPASMGDGYVFRRTYNAIVWFLADQVTAFKTSISRSVRQMFKDFLLEAMDQFEDLQVLGLKKNWLQEPPDYHRGTTDAPEKLTVMEVAQLWNRLSTRYDTLEFTNYMRNLASDADLKAVIAQGQAVLRKHIVNLEKLATDYSIPLPAKPPEEESVGQPLDAIPNAYVFRQVLRGMQAYFTVHIIAFQHSTTPVVRQTLKQLLQREIDAYDKFIAYGQLRGWLPEQPAHRF